MMITYGNKWHYFSVAKVTYFVKKEYQQSISGIFIFLTAYIYSEQKKELCL